MRQMLWRWWVLAICALSTAGCALFMAPVPGEQAELARKLPSRPEKPPARPTIIDHASSSEAVRQIQSHAVAALPNFSRVSVGVLGFAPPDFSQSGQQIFLNNKVIFPLLTRGAKRVVDLSGSGEILAMVHRQTGRTGAMTENWWMGRMDQMVEAAAVSRTDYVLIGHFEALESFQVESQAPQTVNAEELEAYRTVYEPYLSQVRVYLYAISDERAEHQRLGRTGARVDWVENEYRIFTAVQEKLVSPEELLVGISRDGDTQMKNRYRARLMVRLYATATGEIAWMGRFTIEDGTS